MLIKRIAGGGVTLFGDPNTPGLDRDVRDEAFSAIASDSAGLADQARIRLESAQAKAKLFLEQASTNTRALQFSIAASKLASDAMIANNINPHAAEIKQRCAAVRTAVDAARSHASRNEVDDAAKALDQARAMFEDAQALKERGESELNAAHSEQSTLDNMCTDAEPCAGYCQSDHFEACVRAGAMYLDGNGVGRDENKALALFKKGCDGGIGAGCNSVAFMYAKGRGVPRSMTTAQTYFQKGCDAHFDTACQNFAGVKCINDAKAPGQRRPAQDAKCEVAKHAPQSVLIADGRRHYAAFEAPDSSQLDICSEFMKSDGCFQINLIAQAATIYCCPQ
jgi:TPR repeat protein